MVQKVEFQLSLKRVWHTVLRSQAIAVKNAWRNMKPLTAPFKTRLNFILLKATTISRGFVAGLICGLAMLFSGCASTPDPTTQYSNIVTRVPDLAPDKGRIWFYSCLSAQSVDVKSANGQVVCSLRSGATMAFVDLPAGEYTFNNNLPWAFKRKITTRLALGETKYIRIFLGDTETYCFRVILPEYAVRDLAQCQYVGDMTVLTGTQSEPEAAVTSCTNYPSIDLNKFGVQLPVMPPGFGRVFLCYDKVNATAHTNYIDGRTIFEGANLGGLWVYLDLPEGEHRMMHSDFYTYLLIPPLLLFESRHPLMPPEGNVTFRVCAGQQFVVEQKACRSVLQRSVNPEHEIHAWFPLFIAPEQAGEVLRAHTYGGSSWK
jgi:hypothetical protein